MAKTQARFVNTEGEYRRWENERRRERQAKIKKKIKPGDRACFYAEWTCYRGGTYKWYWALIPKGMTEDEAEARHPPIEEMCGPFTSQEKAEDDWKRAKIGLS